MNSGRLTAAGKTRTCPHCKATILDSSSICPACHHHLRFDTTPERPPPPSFSPLRIEGTIRHPSVGEPWEYCVVLTICNDRGEEIARQVVGVGALHAAEVRTFSLCVEVFTPQSRPGLD